MKTRNDNGRCASGWTRTRRRRRRRRQGKHEERTKKKEEKERKTEICWSMIYTRRRKIVERAVAPSWWLVLLVLPARFIPSLSDDWQCSSLSLDASFFSSVASSTLQIFPSFIILFIFLASDPTAFCLPMEMPCRPTAVSSSSLTDPTLFNPRVHFTPTPSPELSEYY